MRHRGSRSTTLSLGVVLTIVAIACSPDPTAPTDTEGASEDGGDDGEEDWCLEDDIALESLDEPSVTGTTPAAVLADFEGTWTGTISYYANEFLAHVQAGETRAVTVTVTYEGGAIVDHDRTALDPGAEMYGCSDGLSIEVTLGIVADDASMDESIDASVSFSVSGSIQPGGSRLFAAFDPDEEPGGLEVEHLGLMPDVDFEGVYVDAMSSDDELRASLRAAYRKGSSPFEVTFAEFVVSR